MPKNLYRRLACGFLGLAVLLGGALSAQAKLYDVEIRVDTVEDLYELSEQGDLDDDDLELLLALFYRPLDINRVDRYALYDLPGVTYDLADAIVRHRRDFGRFEKVEDLLKVEGMDQDVYDSFWPFVRVVDAAEAAQSKTAKGNLLLGAVYDADLGESFRSTVYPTPLPSGYLIGRAVVGDYFGGGILLTARPLLRDVVWDQSVGFLVAPTASCATETHGCAPPTYDLERIYGVYTKGAWRIIAGNYVAGFGERLVFDSTSKRHPNGWEEPLALNVDRAEGRITPRRSQRGVAVSLDDADLPFAWVDATVFGSVQDYDLYQYDLRYHGDFDGGLSCETSSDCPAGYSCGDDNMCYSGRVYVNDGSGRSFVYGNYDDVVREMMVGGNLTMNFTERNRVGLTSYAAQGSMNLPEAAHAFPSSSARWPQDENYGASGLYAVVGSGPVEFGAEVAMTHAGDLGAVVRTTFVPADRMEFRADAYYYGADFENPHARSTSTASEWYGLRHRRKKGVQLSADLAPRSGLELRSRLQLNGRLYLSPDYDRDVEWREQVLDKFDLYAQQGVKFKLTSKERANIWVSYQDQLVGDDARDFYPASSTRDYLPDQIYKAYASVTSKRFANTSVALYLGLRAQEERSGFDVSYQYLDNDTVVTDEAYVRTEGWVFYQSVRLRASRKFGADTTLVGSLIWHPIATGPSQIETPEGTDPEDDALRARLTSLEDSGELKEASASVLRARGYSDYDPYFRGSLVLNHRFGSSGLRAQMGVGISSERRRCDYDEDDLITLDSTDVVCLVDRTLVNADDEVVEQPAIDDFEYFGSFRLSYEF